SVYPAISGNDNHGCKGDRYPVCRGGLTIDRSSSGILHHPHMMTAESVAADPSEDRDKSLRPSCAVDDRDDDFEGRQRKVLWHRLGTRASANTSGPDFTLSPQTQSEF